MAPTTAAATVASSGSSTPASDDTLFGVPKWALAVAAGGVVAAGVLYYVLSSPGSVFKQTLREYSLFFEKYKIKLVL